MSAPNDGGPAFPLQSIGPEFVPGHCGMSLRDWFAGRCPEEEIPKFTVGDAMKRFGDDKPHRFQLLRSEARYAWADSMLAARERKEGAS